MDQFQYVESLLQFYLGLPETPVQASPADIRLAHHLFQQQIPFAIVEAALLLASIRRLFRDPSLPPLSPIRSLNYFLPIVQEVSANPLPEGYLQYLRFKLESYACRNRASD